MIGLHRLQQPGHVFDAERIGPEILQLLGHAHEPVDGMDRADRVADGCFDMLAAGFDLAYGAVHVPDIVQGVEDAEDIDAVDGGALDEPFQHVVGIVPVANQVLSAQQHLQPGVGHGGAEGAEPLPRIFFQEAQTGVERGAAPDLKRPVSDGVQLLRDRQHVLGAHARGEEGLMPVAKGDIGDQDLVSGGRLELHLGRFGRLRARGAHHRSASGFLGRCLF